MTWPTWLLLLTTWTWAPHDFHLTYARVAVEGTLVQARIRFFADDLERGLAAMAGRGVVALSVDAETDSLVTAYVNARFLVDAGSGPLPGAIVTSGQEEDGKQPVWWYLFGYESAESVTRLTVTNRLLIELFDDQTNIVRAQRFPEGRELTYYLTRSDTVATFSW